MYEINRSIDQTESMTIDFYPEAASQALNLTLTMGSNVENGIAFQLIVDANAIVPEIGVISAALILIFFNILIGAEVQNMFRHSRCIYNGNIAF